MPQERPFFPERYNIPHQRGGTRLGVSAPPLTDSTTITREPPTTQPHPDEQSTKPKKGKVLRNLAIWFTSLTAMGGTVYEAYQQIPAVHRMVDSLFPGHLRGDSLVSTDTTTKPEAKFDNTARSGVIKTIKRISEEDTAKLDSFAKIHDHNTTLAIYPIDISTSNKPDAKIKYNKGYGGSGSQKDIAERREQGYLNIFYFEKVPAGTTIFASKDGRLILHREKDIANDHPFSKAVIEFEESEGKTYEIMISGSPTKGGGMMNPPSFDIFRSLTNAPAYEPSTSQDILEVYKQAIDVKKDQPIMQTAKEINLGFDVRFVMRSNTDMSNFKKIGEEIVNGQKMGNILQEPPTNLELFLSEDGQIVQPQLPNN